MSSDSGEDSSENGDMPPENQFRRRKPRVLLTDEKVDIAKNLLKDKKKPKDIAHVLNISERSARRLVQSLESTENENEIGDYIIHKPGPKPKSKRAIKAAIADIVQQDNALTLEGISDRLRDFNIFKKKSTVHNTLKSMKYKRKRLRPVAYERNSERVIADREVYCRELMEMADKDLFYLDESGFNLHTSAHYGYAPPNETPRILVPGNRGRNISLLSVLSSEG